MFLCPIFHLGTNELIVNFRRDSHSPAQPIPWPHAPPSPLHPSHFHDQIRLNAKPREL